MAALKSYMNIASQAREKSLSIHSVPIHGTNGIDSTGTVRVLQLSTLARCMRAGKRLILCWLIALLSVAIPGLHFILVPGFFIAGIIVFGITLREKFRIAGGEASCPACKTSYEIAEQAFRFPLEIICPECGQYAWVESIAETVRSTDRDLP